MPSDGDKSKADGAIPGDGSGTSAGDKSNEVRRDDNAGDGSKADDAFHEDGAAGHTPAAAAKRQTKSPSRPKKRKARVRKAAPAPAPKDDDDDDAEDGQQQEVTGISDDMVVDVGSLPTLPSLPSPTGSSVPVRRKDGVKRATALDAFLQEMGRYPVLSTEEERELTLKYYNERDPKAARKLVVHNLRLVVKMAYKYRRAWASVLDLIQEGNVGLVEAVQRFDPFKGAKFSTYATFWIRAYMLRYLLEHSRTVRISRTRVGRKLFFQLAKERAKLRAQGIDPGPKLLAERLGVKEEDLEEVVRHMDQPEIRLDAPAHNDDAQGSTILDTMSVGGASPEAEAFRREFSEDVSTALDGFAATLTDEREKAAWAEHLMAEDPVSLSDLGQRFGVTKQRMGQIVASMRKRLKVHLIDRLGPDVELGYQFDAE